MQDWASEFWALIEAHYTSLWHFSLGLTRSRVEAKDLISDVVLAAYRSYPRLRDKQAFQKSLFTIATRINRRQQWRRRIFSSVKTDEWTIDAPEESSHDLELLMSALHQLPQKQSEALLLFEISGFSIEEIHAIQGGSISGIKSRLQRGREALRKILADDAILTDSVIKLNEVSVTA